VFAPLDKVGFIPHWCKGCWLIVIFGACQLMAWLIMRGSPVSPLIDKDYECVTLDSLVAMMLQ
jgi:hypothetical protein